jgi:hypothetical protein
MSERRAAEMEVEALNYWFAMRKLNSAYYADSFDPFAIDAAAQDLGDIFHCTDWPLMRERCRDAIDPAARIANESVA